MKIQTEDCAWVVTVAVLALLIVGLATWARSADFVWAPGTDPETLYCVELCAGACGLDGRQATLADSVRLRRALAGAP